MHSFLLTTPHEVSITANSLLKMFTLKINLPRVIYFIFAEDYIVTYIDLTVTVKSLLINNMHITFELSAIILLLLSKPM